MHRLFLFAFAVTITTTLSAQFQIGHTSRTFLDPARNNRPVLTDIYYPADQSGDNLPLAAGEFPVISFGHGFVMVWSAYQNFWESLVPQGFILCFPRTEGSFSPSHSDFARDLAFICTAMETEKLEPTSPFFGHIQSRYCVMGHSMGGGCTVLAYQYNPALIKCVATFAPANTNPSAIAVAPAVSVPSLTFAGTNDCIAPPAQQAQLIFEALDSTACKIYVNIDGASHCQFANANTNCNLGEVFSGCANPPLAAAAQQELVNAVLLPWLHTYLLQNPAYLTPLLDVLAAENGFAALVQCSSTSGIVQAPRAEPKLEILQNPVVGEELRFRITTGKTPGPTQVFLYDLRGRSLTRQLSGPEGDVQRLSLAGYPSGLYYLAVMPEAGPGIVRKFIKL